MVEEYKNILVAVDGSEQAYDALREAVDTAKLNHSHLKNTHDISDTYISRAHSHTLHKRFYSYGCIQNLVHSEL